MRILVFGSSISQGFWDTQGGWVQRLRHYCDTISLQDLNNDIQPSIFNLGISGNTSRDILTRIESETRARQEPDQKLRVIIEIGINDGLFEAGAQWVLIDEFRTNLETIIAKLTPFTNDIIFVGIIACDETKTTPVSWGDYTYTNTEIEKYEKISKELAKAHNLPFVPLFHAFKAKLDDGVDLLADGLHPNDAGHQFIMEQVRAVVLGGKEWPYKVFGGV